MKNEIDPEKIYDLKNHKNIHSHSSEAHAYFEIIFNSKNNIIKSLFENIEDYGFSPIYYFYKGIQYEYGIFKNKSLSLAKEFYIQGANINQPLCFYRLYYIYSLEAEENSKSGNIVQDLHLYFLLKYLSYYDYSSCLNYLIPEEELQKLKNKIKVEYDKIKCFINNKDNQDFFNISQSELEYLTLCLENFKESIDKKVYLNNNLNSMIIFYKDTKHEEALYQIIDYCLINKEITFLNKFLAEKLTNKNDLNSKHLALLIKNYLEGQKVNIKIETQTYTSLKIGGYLEIITALKFQAIPYQDLLNISEDENNFEKLKNKFLKKIKYLYSSVMGGDINSIPILFYLIIFLTKQMGDMTIMYESKIVDDILDILEKTYDNLPFNKELKFLLGIFYLRGVKIKKDLIRSKEIFEQIYHEEKTFSNDQSDLSILILYYLIKINNKLSNFEESKNYTEKFLKFIRSEQSVIENPQIIYLIGKLFLKINQIDKSYNVLSDTLKFYNEENSELISFIDKIYLCKIKNFLESRKEFCKFKNTLFSNGKKNENFNFCMYCNFRMKEVLAVPCGHKFICTECYEDKEEYFEFDDLKCENCGTKIESALKKVFN
jgi:hypothetical protein